MRVLSHADLDRLVAQGESSVRRRQHSNLHEDLADPCQRLFNAIGVDSYIRPHRHNLDARTETLLAVRGSFALVQFTDEGRIRSVVRLAARQGSSGSVGIGVVISPAEWHTVLAAERGAVLLEVKAGPFDPHAAKEPAPWAAAEGTPEAIDYLQSLRREVLGDG